MLAVALCLATAACGDDPPPEPLAKVAKRYVDGLRHGQTLGHLTFPRFDKTVPVAAGFDQATIDRGPGWYRGSWLPGEGRTIYVAGHRRTRGGPFRRIGALRAGDRVVFTTPYAVATYTVTRHEVVSERRTSLLVSGRREELRLQSSTIPPGHNRLLVFARLERISPSG